MTAIHDILPHKSVDVTPAIPPAIASGALCEARRMS